MFDVLLQINFTCHKEDEVGAIERKLGNFLATQCHCFDISLEVLDITEEEKEEEEEEE